MASLPPAGGDLTVEFKGDSAELSRTAAEQLRTLAARLKDKDARLQLKAYASGGADGASRAKRVSLSRGLAVRSYLIDQGMRSTQIDVRALGVVRDGGPDDRVDVAVLAQ
jgi:outer membrane protein OmpA-like peptidoglycan-associated protein